jgi:putative component of membrane protein insertase Oxa1/YidC/SpoIIIJ protein YidD
MTAAALALAAIRCYQRRISPHKGFSCALRVATGGAGCSAYGYAVIESADTALDMAGCACDAGDCWPSRRRGGRARTTGELDAAVERARRRETRIRQERGR